MPSPATNNYLDRLPRSAAPGQRIWLGQDGSARGQYFNCTLTSVFQPVREIDSTRIVAYEAFIRSYSKTDGGLSVWKLLEQAASDDESVELDRLCRMLHVLNFHRQAEAAGADLYLSVHDRLLAAVGSNHGMVFRRVLDNLGLPAEKIVLQLPQSTPNQGWLLDYVADNYRRNRFRVAVNVANAADGLQLLERVRPDAIKLDGREITDPDGVEALLRKCRTLGVELLFKRVESEMVVDVLAGMPADGRPILAQGHAWDLPKAALDRRSGHEHAATSARSLAKPGDTASRAEAA